MSTFQEAQDLQTVVDMAEEFKDMAEKRIRIIRAVVYEGDAKSVFECLARSLPIGVKDCNGYYTITILQGETKVLES